MTFVKNLLPFLLIFFMISGCDPKKQANSKQEKAAGPITLVIHGGAGTIKRENMTPEKEKAYREGLNQALEAGFAVLENGGTSMDAVIAAVKVMEDNPLFNAGKGAVFT